MVVVVEALDCRILYSAVHSLDLAIGPRMTGLGQAMFDVEISASHLERVAAKGHVIPAHGIDVFRCPTVASGVGLRPSWTDGRP